MAEFFAYIVLGIIVMFIIGVIVAGLLLLAGAVVYVVLLPFLILLGVGNKVS